MNKHGIRYPHLLNALTNKVWAIQPPFLNSIATTLYNASHGAQPLAGVLNQDDDEPNLSEVKDSPSIAVIPVHGIIGRHLSSLETMCGGCDLDAVEADLQAALEDPTVEAIVLHVDSPGGVTDGIDAAAEAISEAAREKPVIAFTDTMMCSAAYWLCAGATEIHATAFADVGSIGVYMAWIDQSKFMEKEGLELKLFKAGRLKAMFMPGQMSEEASAHLQAQIDLIYESFTGKVLQHRSAVAADTMQGQSFLGRQALDLHLVDDVVQSFADTLAIVSSTFTPVPSV